VAAVATLAAERRRPGYRWLYVLLRQSCIRGLAGSPRSGRLRLLNEGSVSPYALFALALLASVLLGAWLGRLWQQQEQRDIEKKWQERERLLDRRRPMATRQEILRRRVRPGRPASLARGRRSGRR